MTIREKKSSGGHERSPEWRKVRNNFIKKNPVCACCGKKKKLQVHHIIPFSFNPDLELVESNLITLCTNKTLNCHLVVGHRMNFRNQNLNIMRDLMNVKMIVRSPSENKE